MHRVFFVLSGEDGTCSTDDNASRQSMLDYNCGWFRRSGHDPYLKERSRLISGAALPMDNTQIITLITAFAAYITPRILAFVGGDGERKRAVGSIISVIVGVLVAAVESEVWVAIADMSLDNFSFGTLAALLLGSVGTKSGSQAMYEGHWKDKLNPASKDKPDADAASGLEQRRDPGTGSFASGGVIDNPMPWHSPDTQEHVVMDVPHENPVGQSATSAAFSEAAQWAAEPEPEQVIDDDKWGPVEQFESIDDPEGFGAGWEYLQDLADQENEGAV